MATDAPKVKEDALALKSTIILRIFLSIIGSWPADALGKNMSLFARFWRKYILFQASFLFISEARYLKEKFQVLPFFDLGHMYITSFISILIILTLGVSITGDFTVAFITMRKIITFQGRLALGNLKKYGDISRQLMMEFHLIHHQEKGPYYKKIFELVDKVTFYIAVYLTIIMIIASACFSITPLYNNYKAGWFTNGAPPNATPEFSVYYKFPGIDINDHLYVISLFNYMVAVECGCSICTVDLYLSVMIFQIIGHIIILRHNLENLPLPKGQAANFGQFTVQMYDRDENLMIHEKLKECVIYHKMIVDFTDEMSTVYGPTLALYYLFHSVSCCLLLLECSRGDAEALTRYGPLTVIVFTQLIQISIVFEVVNTVSVKLFDTVYCVPWELMNVSNRRSVSIILNRVQIPIQVTAMGIASVGVQTMAGILKTSFSYFMFLRTMNE